VRPWGTASFVDPAPIGDYGLLGDTRTTALVSSEGSIDWLCFPRPESSPLFGRLLDRHGGSFSVTVQDGTVASRRYADRTASVETVASTGSAEVTRREGMVVDVRSELSPQALLVREVTCRGGEARIRVRFDPRDGWSGGPLEWTRRSGALVASRGRRVLTLTTAPDLGLRSGEEIEVAMRDGDRVVLALGLSDGEPGVVVDPAAAARRLMESETWWRGWAGDVDAGPVEPDAVLRSLMTLRLLTYGPSGAPVAAPTTSLPERVGGDKNWDYRYAWVRDASLGTSAFVACGKPAEAAAFLSWMLHASRLTRPRLHVAYDVLGRIGATREQELDQLEGYRGSLPVRIGNAAAQQFQLDVYGWMIDAGWGLASAGEPLVAETRRSLWGHADVLARRWRDPDHGIWEERAQRRHHVFSKTMAWLGLDRAVRLGAGSGVADRRVRRWSTERGRIADAVRDRGFDERRGAYTQEFGGRALDAAVLLMPVAGIERGDSPRVLRTIDAIRAELGAGGPLLYRYRGDGADEGAFLPCSFWLVQALAAAGLRDEACEVFSATCRLATPLGLFAEELDPGTGEHLGNFPQALTHAALVHAALALR
jgi:GH15 family glucan-1,4-alpha-glucosidase